jgi:hypothetical protein
MTPPDVWTSVRLYIFQGLSVYHARAEPALDPGLPVTLGPSGGRIAWPYGRPEVRAPDPRCLPAAPGLTGPCSTAYSCCSLAHPAHLLTRARRCPRVLQHNLRGPGGSSTTRSRGFWCAPRLVAFLVLSVTRATGERCERRALEFFLTETEIY